MTGLIKIAVGVVAVAASATVFFKKADQKVFLPGHTSPGHHQIEGKCEACHTPFGGVVQSACVACHGEAMNAAEDSHTTGKFEDPRNALQLGRLDATKCVECHREHRPEQTDHVGVTAKLGFCSECHREIGRERPTHANLAFTTCTNIGCHNFHDNRSVYGEFLSKHRDEPDLLAKPAVMLLGVQPATKPAVAAAPAPATGAPVIEGPQPPAPPAPAKAVTAAGVADAPIAPDDLGATDPARLTVVTADWDRSAHKRAGVSCSSCHRAGGKSDAAWKWRPEPTASCERCHNDEERTFKSGKHGMRLAVGLEPMQPALALVPSKMKPAALANPNAHETSLTCARCHDVHAPDLRVAAVESCEGCHDDGHTRTYRKSAHFARWQAELTGASPAGTGVSCATCHLPRTLDRDGAEPRAWADHNQNGNLRPVDKMARSVCMSCHGLAFSLASLADPALVAANFNGQPKPVRTGFDLLAARPHAGAAKTAPPAPAPSQPSPRSAQ